MIETKEELIRAENKCESIRKEIIEACYQNGGHLSSNLGMVEVSYALFSCFDLPKDDVLFDVGHQAYAYKILSGRSLNRLRKKGGISPFTLREESPYDKYDSGHSGDSLPIAIGMALSKEAMDDKTYTIVVIGDASLKNGLSLEAITFLSGKKDLKRLIILVNVNGMAIKKEATQKAEDDSRLREEWIQERLEKGKEYTNKEWVEIVRQRREESIKEDSYPSSLRYLGKVEGHDILSLIEALETAKKESENGPTILEVLTRKGMGFKEAEEDEIGRYHGVNPGFRLEDGKYDFAYEKENLLLDRMKDDPALYVITPAMEFNSSLSRLFSSYPERTIDVGIAEENAVALGSGLALKGKHVVIDIYSTFFQRTVDQVLMDFSRQELPALFLLERASLVGEDGSSHQGIFDLPLLFSIPHAHIYMPYDKKSLDYLFHRPELFSTLSFLRFPKEKMEDYPKLNFSSGFAWKKKEGKKPLLLSLGPNGYHALEVTKETDMALLLSLSDFDSDVLLSYDRILFYDPYSTKEGMTSALLRKLNAAHYKGEFSSLCLEKAFYPFGSEEEELKETGCDIASAKEFFEK